MAYTYYLADCSQDAFEACYYNGIVNGVFVKSVEPGDTIVLPAGSATWGASNRGNAGRIYLILPITVRGQGDSTIISIDSSGSRNGVINLMSDITFADVKMLGPNSGSPAAFSSYGYNNTAPGGINYVGGFRITNVTYIGGTAGAYFLQVTVYGLVDNCRITGGSGDSELIFMRGPGDAWQLNNTIGTYNNVFVEDCVFNGTGYVCDANANAYMTVRFCTITGTIKVDGHGVYSNTPARSVRNMEVYHNTWTSSDPGGWTAIEMRGGVCRLFNNTNTGTRGAFFLTDYGYLVAAPNFGNVYQTPTYYPIKDQIGVGKDPKVAGSEPTYVWGNKRSTNPWQREFKAIPAAAITQYRTETGNASATFDESTMIQANRDFYADSGFDAGGTGVSIGTAAEMAATTPTTQSVGFWVTDEGSWNQSGTGSQGRLYTWSASAWNLYYEPYTYPHPLRSASVDLTPTPTISITPTISLTPDTPTPTPTITVTPTNTPTVTPTLSPTVTPTITPTLTPTPSITVTITPTNTSSPTLTLTPTSTIYPIISVNPLYYGSRSFPLWEKSTYTLNDEKTENIGPRNSIIYEGAIVPLTASQVYYSLDYYAIYPPHTIYSADAFWYITAKGFTASYDPNTIVKIGANVNITGFDSGIRAIYR